MSLKTCLLLACWLLVASRLAQAEPLPWCRMAPGDPSRLAVEPCRPVPPLPGRRGVPQTIERMPPAAPAYRPVAPETLLAVPAPGAPLPLVGCGDGTCRDLSGMPQTGGVGNAIVTPQGRLCQRHGVWLQCF